MIRCVWAAREFLPLSRGEGQEGFKEEVPRDPECGDRERASRQRKGMSAGKVAVGGQSQGVAGWGWWEAGALEGGRSGLRFVSACV